MKLNSIRSKLIISLISICVIPLLIVGIFTYNQSKSILNNKLNVTSTQTLSEINNGLTNYFDEFTHMTKVVSKNYNVVNVDIGDNFNFVPDVLKALKESDNDVLGAFYGTASHKFSIYPNNKMPDGYDATSRPWYKKAVEAGGKAIITQPYKDIATGKLVVYISQAVIKDGKVVGVIGMNCTLSTLADQIATKKVGNLGYVFITDKQGIILAHPNKKLINTNEALKLPFWSKVKNEKSGFTQYTYDNAKRFGAFQTNKFTGWKLVATLDESELTKDTKLIVVTTSIIIIVMALIAICMSLLLSKGIAINVKKLKEVFEKASNGDLSEVIDVRSKDELGQLGKDYNSMIKNIGVLLQSAKQTSDVVLDTSSNLSSMAEETSASMSQVASAVSEIATGANNLAENSQETVGEVEKLSKKLDDIVVVVSNMNNVSHDTQNLSDQGIETVNMLISKNDETMEVSIKVADIVSDMGRSVKEISSISDAINEITEQTNLLSLNASIEAARAGQAGKGFAVVADEIRKLAEQSKNSTEQIKKIIENVQEKATNAVEAMKSNKEIGLEQNSAVLKTEQIFKDILDSIVILTKKVEEVKNSVDDIHGQNQIFVDQIENTSAISEETASSTEEVTASTEEVTATMDKFTGNTAELKELAEKLKKEIGKFKI